ncbi:MAG: hypothetical protein L0Y73_01925 [Candidatus Aminicenantes bacterium]|nr:hypothetical protein [Candidatus Aminicenantes bacterium]
MTDNNTFNSQPGKKQSEEKRFKVIFEGKIKSDISLPVVKERIADLFQVNIAGVESIFSQLPRTLKSNLPLEMAYKYKTAFEQTGALCIIKEMIETPAVPELTPPTPPPSPPPPKIPFSPRLIPPSEEPPVAEIAPPPPTDLPPPIELETITLLEQPQPHKKMAFSPKKIPPTAEPLFFPESSPEPEIPPFTPEPPPPIDSSLLEFDDEIQTGDSMPPGRGGSPAPGVIIAKPGAPAYREATLHAADMPAPIQGKTPGISKITPSVKIPDIKPQAPLKRLIPLIVILVILSVVAYVALKPKSSSEKKVKETGSPAASELPTDSSVKRTTATPIQSAELATFNDPHGFYSLLLPEGYSKNDESSGDVSKINFSYWERTSITITANPMKDEWKAEEEMKKKVKEIESGSAGTLSLYTITAYNLTAIDEAQGYELLMERTGILCHHFYLVVPGKNAVSLTIITEGSDRQAKHDYLVGKIQDNLQIF